MRDAVQSQAIVVMENVACSADDIVAALEAGTLRPGLGFDRGPVHGRRARTAASEPTSGDGQHLGAGSQHLDCLRCTERMCLYGEDCRGLPTESAPIPDAATRRILEAAMDVALEDERQLCRLAELVYFCLDMGYERIGVPFCIDLHEPAGILSGVLGRFFHVVPVCCKVGGRSLRQLTGGTDDRDSRSSDSVIACNPLAQAEVLNRAGTELNVIVGLCIGADCVLTRASQAPVTTLFVKDKSLANNPIGAVYSEYYLRESAAPDGPTPTAGPFGQRVSSREEAS
jgi:uncharacterized metal-binding protein